MRNFFFKLLAVTHVFLYRLSRGKLGSEMKGFHVLLLTTRGRKSGKQRTTPLGYFEHDGGFVIIGSNAGLDTHPAWFYNLRNNPRATIQVKDSVFEVTAEVVGAEARGQLWTRLMELAPGYAAYEKRTTREIPLVILQPTQPGN